MKLVSKTILACSFAAASMFGAASAQADQFNSFTFNPDGTYANVVADKITGNYVETATFNSNGTFNVSLMWTAGQFVTDGGTTPLAGGDTGLGNTYGIYALYKGSGTSSTVNGVTTFTFTPSASDSLQLYLDTSRNTKTAALATSGTGDFTLSGASDDILLGAGSPIDGVGSLNTQLSTCGTKGINCGSFGASSTFALTAIGSSYFISPVPFFNLTMQSGQLNNFQASGTQTINGSLDVVFANAVPEPASLGLLGLGLLGLGFVRGRKQS